MRTSCDRQPKGSLEQTPLLVPDPTREGNVGPTPSSGHKGPACPGTGTRGPGHMDSSPAGLAPPVPAHSPRGPWELGHPPPPAPATAWGGAWPSILGCSWPERTFQLLSQTPTVLSALKPDSRRGAGRRPRASTDPLLPAPQGHLGARKGRSGAAWLQPQDQGLGSTWPRASPNPWQQPLSPWQAAGQTEDLGREPWEGSTRSARLLPPLGGEQTPVRGRPEAG